MNKINLSLYCLFSLLSYGGLGQTIDTALLTCKYNMQYAVDTVSMKYNNDIIVLKVGKRCSASYSSYTFESDSILALPDGPQIMGNLLSAGLSTKKFPRKRSGFYIYKNYPNGKTSVLDIIQLEKFKYVEDFEPQAWEILDDTTEILGYECQKAQCDFRGRRYYAWFTPEIPISDGPWKFSGLPGLILYIADSKEHYKFEITEIVSSTKTPIQFAFKGYKYIKTNRIDFLKTAMRARIDSGGYLRATTSVRIDGVTDSNPRIIKYDFMELDYKK